MEKSPNQEKITYMGRCTLISFFLSSFFLQTFSSLDFPVGSQVSVPIPSLYQPDFKEIAYVLRSSLDSPNFRAALSVKAINGRYFCSLIVVFDDLNVWASDHVVKFIPAGTCHLELTQDGNLQVKDQFGFVGWESGTSNRGVKMLHLEEGSGNLVLIDEANQITWQSFVHPTDTILWGQVLKDLSPLTVFPNNSLLFYSFEIVHEKIVAYINWRNHKYSYWQLKPQGKRTISFMRLGVIGLKIFDENSHKIAQIMSGGTEPIRIFTLGNDGNLGFYHYSMNLRRFRPSNKLLGLCDLPLPCGLYGICSLESTCRYLQTRSIRERINEIFEMGEYNGICGLLGSEVEMVKLEGIQTILSSPFPIFNTSEDSCVSSCMENCSCDSVAYSDQERRCFQFGLVAGAREVYGQNGESYWAKLPKEIRDKGASDYTVKRFVIIGGVIDFVAICIIIAVLMYFYFCVRNKNISVMPPDTENN